MLGSGFVWLGEVFAEGFGQGAGAGIWSVVALAALVAGGITGIMRWKRLKPESGAIQKLAGPALAQGLGCFLGLLLVLLFRDRAITFLFR